MKSNPYVSTLNEVYPTDCPTLLQIRQEFAAWHWSIYKDGYIRYNHGSITTRYEHRLVAQRAYGDIPEGHLVRHLNHNRTDNRAANLMYITRQDHAYHALGTQPKQLHICPVCQTPFRVSQRQINRTLDGNPCCSDECRAMANRKVKARPNAEELLELMTTVGNWTSLGELFGVSDNAVRKWAKQYNLDLSICNGRRKTPPT